mgnify:CR=1 FL=1
MHMAEMACPTQGNHGDGHRLSYFLYEIQVITLHLPVFLD